jgi:hypothetical protein
MAMGDTWRAAASKAGMSLADYLTFQIEQGQREEVAAAIDDVPIAEQAKPLAALGLAWPAWRERGIDASSTVEIRRFMRTAARLIEWQRVEIEIAKARRDA